MVALRKTWGRTLRKALALLKSRNHPIADYTVALVAKRVIEIIPFNKVVKSDFNEFVNDYSDENDENLPHHYPPSKNVIQKMVNNWDAKISANRVTINHEISDPKKIAEILIHEANHFLNESEVHYKTEQQMFAEEFRAKVAESLVFTRAMRTSKLIDIAKEVGLRYNLPLPMTIKMPDGLFVPRVP